MIKKNIYIYISNGVFCQVLLRLKNANAAGRVKSNARSSKHVSIEAPQRPASEESAHGMNNRPAWERQEKWW